MKESIPFCVIGCIMFGVLKLMNTFMAMSIINLLLEILVGTVVFFILSLVYLMLFRKEFGGLLLGKVKGILRLN